MGGVKTLRTGFLVFGPGFKWFTLLAANVLGVRFLCQPWRLPGEAGVESSSLFRPETAPRSRPPCRTGASPWAGGSLPRFCTPQKAWHSEASGRRGMKESEQPAPLHSLNRGSQGGPRKGNPPADARNPPRGCGAGRRRSPSLSSERSAPQTVH